MPKLKSALLAHQSQAQRQAEKKKREQNREANKPGPSKKRKHQSTAAQPTSSTTPSATNASPSTTAHTAPRKARKPTIPFDNLDTILLLGEANFSFARSLLREPHNLAGHMICATSYDSRQVCTTKYPDAEGIISELEGKGVRVLFEVDAGDLPSSVTGKGKGKDKAKGGGGRWSRVIFNFPHAGAGIKDQDRNILSNQHLLLRTLKSVHPILTSGPPPPQGTTSRSKPSKRKRKPEADEENDDAPLEDDDNLDLDLDPDFPGYPSDPTQTQTPAPSSFTPPNRTGTLLITLLDQNPYTLWALPKLAKSPPDFCPGTRIPQPRYTLVRSFAFDPEVYDGYAHRRTIGFKDGVSKAGNEEIVGRKGGARTWEFCRRDEE